MKSAMKIHIMDNEFSPCSIVATSSKYVYSSWGPEVVNYYKTKAFK